MTRSEGLLIRQEVTESGKLRYIMTVPITWRPEPKVTFLDRLKKKAAEPVLEDAREFVFDTMAVGKIGKVVDKIIGMPDELYGDSPAELAIDVVEKYYKDMVYIVAAASFRRNEEPNPELLEFIEMNFTFDMLREGAQIAVTQIGFDAFLNCLMIFKGTSNILKPRSISIEDAIIKAKEAKYAAD